MMGQLGGPAPAGLASCGECGGTFAQAEMIRVATRFICADCKPVFLQKLKEGALAGGHLDYARVGTRLVAVIIDWIILQVLSTVCGIAFGTLNLSPVYDSGSDAFGLKSIAMMVIQMVLLIAYQPFLIGRYGATPGKRVVGIKVVTADGGRVTYARATARYFAKLLSWSTFGIGFLMANWDDERRMLHDRICETRVVRA